MKKLKEKLNEKLSKNGGFTLVEMLIVVAIIAILIAVSIPLVGSSLEKAKEATDAANLRAAKAAATIVYMDNQAAEKPKESKDLNKYYNIDTGEMDKDKPNSGYNKVAQTKDGGGSIDAGGGWVKATYSNTAPYVTVAWAED